MRDWEFCSVKNFGHKDLTKFFKSGSFHCLKTVKYLQIWIVKNHPIRINFRVPNFSWFFAQINILLDPSLLSKEEGWVHVQSYLIINMHHNQGVVKVNNHIFLSLNWFLETQTDFYQMGSNFLKLMPSFLQKKTK